MGFWPFCRFGCHGCFLLCLRAACILDTVNSLWKLSHTEKKMQREVAVLPSPAPDSVSLPGTRSRLGQEVGMGVQTCSHRVRPGHSISWDDPRAQLGLLSSPSLAALCCCFPCAPCGDPSSLGDLAQLTKLAVFPLYIHIDTDIFTWLHWLPLWCQLSSTVFLIQVTAHPWHTREGEGRRAWRWRGWWDQWGAAPGKGSSAPRAPAVAEPAACASRA